MKAEYAATWMGPKPADIDKWPYEDQAEYYSSRYVITDNFTEFKKKTALLVEKHCPPLLAAGIKTMLPMMEFYKEDAYWQIDELLLRHKEVEE